MAIPFQHVGDHLDANRVNESRAAHLTEKWRHRHDDTEKGDAGVKPHHKINPAGAQLAVSSGMMNRSLTPPGSGRVEQPASHGFRGSPLTASHSTANFGSTTIPAGTSLHSLNASQIQGGAPRMNESVMSFGPAPGAQQSITMSDAHPLATAHKKQLAHQDLGYSSSQVVTSAIDMSPGGSYTVQIPSHATGRPQAQAAVRQQQPLEGQRFTSETAPEARSGHSGEPALLKKQKHSRKSKTGGKRQQEQKKKGSGCC